MSEQVQISEQITPAEQLGFVDGEFLVRRNDGSIESGWSVVGVGDDEMGNTGELVHLVKPVYNKDGQLSGRLEKDVYKTALTEWNTLPPQAEADYSLEIDPSTERRKLLFLPVEQQDDDGLGYKFDLDHLLDPDSDEYTAEDAAVRQEESVRDRVTPESEIDAVAALREATQSDQLLSEIIARYTAQDQDGAIHDAKDLPKLLRKDAALRLLVGEHLLRKADQMAIDLPPRVRRDAQKNAGALGYKHIAALKSREYVALLALSMLDGTFHSSAADTETYDSRTETGSGQHRYAARQVLFTRDIARVG